MFSGNIACGWSGPRGRRVRIDHHRHRGTIWVGLYGRFSAVGEALFVPDGTERYGPFRDR